MCPFSNVNFVTVYFVINCQMVEKMDFRSKSIYECQSPVLLRRVSVPYTDRKTVSFRPRKTVDTDTGEIIYRHVRETVNLDNRSIPLVVRCGHCEHCRKYQNDEWSTRMIMEQIGSECAVFFVTLSFGESHYKRISSVEKTQVYRDYVVPFKKRLRSYGLKFRFYCVSELGEQYGRFHFHMILFVESNELVTLRDSAKDFCLKYANPSSDYYKSIRLYVKGSDGKYRLQSDIEVYLQCMVMRAWCDSKQRYNVSPNIYITVNDGKQVKSVSYSDQIGWVTLSQCESFGAMRYITSYATKCQHDGVTTYHRQSPALGKCYVDNDIRGSKTMLESGDSRADYWTYGSLPILLPRYFIRKFMPEQKRYDRFWKYYDSIPVHQMTALLPKSFDVWDSSAPLLAYQSRLLAIPQMKWTLEQLAWLDTLEYVDEEMKKGRKGFTSQQINKIYQKNLDYALHYRKKWSSVRPDRRCAFGNQSVQSTCAERTEEGFSSLRKEGLLFD